MSTRLKLDEFSKLSGEQRDARLRAFASATAGKPNGEILTVTARISALEQSIGADEATIKRELSEGTRRETLEVCNLLMLAHRRDRLNARR